MNRVLPGGRGDWRIVQPSDGELKGLTKTLVQTRNQAMERLVEQARARGANGVLAFRFDVTEAADTGTEVCAYGTAVVLARE